MGMKILYHLINDRDDSYCERVFAPWLTWRKRCVSMVYPLQPGNQNPVSEFDLLGFTLQHEMSYTNVLNMLDLAGIPLYAAERNKEGSGRNDFPFIIVGGPAPITWNRLRTLLILRPWVKEELIGELLDRYGNGNVRESRMAFWSRTIPGIYVPCL